MANRKCTYNKLTVFPSLFHRSPLYYFYLGVIRNIQTAIQSAKLPRYTISRQDVLKRWQIKCSPLGSLSSLLHSIFENTCSEFVLQPEIIKESQNRKAYIPPRVFFWSRWGRQRNRFCVGNISNNIFQPPKNLICRRGWHNQLS